jgi:CrcB protein
MSRFLMICLGGALGTGARYALTGWAAQAFGPSFPFGTLLVNLVGSFLISAVMEIGLATELLPAPARMTLTAGVLGGFTTYSSFSYETLELFRRGAWAIGIVNVTVTVAGCLVACLLGLWAARALVSNAS